MATVEPSGLIETMWLNSNGRGMFYQVRNMLPQKCYLGNEGVA